MPSTRSILSFLGVLACSTLGGWLWSSIGLPLGWLLGAAVTTGAFAMSGLPVTVFKTPHRAGMILIGTSVGLALSPEVASRILGWAPLMLFAAILGMAAACISAPLFARYGRISPTTAYFSLLPGGVIEMARIGEDNGADPTVIAAIHAVRVALVVGILPIALFAVLPDAHVDGNANSVVSPVHLIAAFGVGTLGSWLGHRLGLPAAWLLGAVLSVGVLAGSGAVQGTLPVELLAAAQVIVGMALGARFQRARMVAIPRAIAAGIPCILTIIALMAAAAALAAVAMSQSIGSFILAFSVGGMAEMVLTAKSLDQDVVMVAAFQTVRAIIVNASAGAVWRHVGRRFLERGQSP